MSSSREAWMQLGSLVRLDGQPGMGNPIRRDGMDKVLTNKESAPWTLSKLRFRDPDKFVTGGIHTKLVSWERVLEENPKRELIFRWIRDGIDFEEFGHVFVVHFRLSVMIVICRCLVFFAIMVRVKGSRDLLVTPYCSVFTRVWSKCGEE